VHGVSAARTEPPTLLDSRRCVRGADGQLEAITPEALQNLLSDAINSVLDHETFISELGPKIQNAAPPQQVRFPVQDALTYTHRYRLPDEANVNQSTSYSLEPRAGGGNDCAAATA